MCKLEPVIPSPRGLLYIDRVVHKKSGYGQRCSITVLLVRGGPRGSSVVLRMWMAFVVGAK